MTWCAASIASVSWYLLLIRSGSFMYGPIVTGLRGSSAVTRSVTGSEVVAHHLRVGEVLDAPLLVAREEPVEGDDRGQLHLRVLGDTQRDDVQVVDGLRVAREEDQPAGVEREVDVGVVAADVERGADRAGGDVEQHRKAGARLDRQLLERVEEPLRAGRVEDAAASRRGAVADAGRAVLAVGRDHHDRVLALGPHGVEVLRDLGRGRDRVVAHDVEIDVLRGDGGHLVAAAEVGDLLGRRRCEHRRHQAVASSHGKSGTRWAAAQPGSSRISVSAPVGQTSVHLRQPLQ